VCELISPLLALDLPFQLFSPFGIAQHVVKASDTTRDLIAIVIVLLANSVRKRCTSIG